MQARIEPEVAARRRDAIGQLLSIRASLFHAQAAEIPPGSDACLIAHVRGIDLLAELEVVGQVRVDGLRAAQRIHIVGHRVESVVILLEGIPELQRARLRQRQDVVGAEFGGGVILVKAQVVVPGGGRRNEGVVDVIIVFVLLRGGSMCREIQRLAGRRELLGESQLLVQIGLWIVSRAQASRGARDDAARRAAIVQFRVGAQTPAIGPARRAAEGLPVAQCVLPGQFHRRNLAANPFIDGALVVDQLRGGRIRRDQVRLDEPMAVVLSISRGGGHGERP